MVRAADDTRADAAILDRIAARDASAVGELYDRHASLLFGVIVRIVQDRGDAEDVLQEAILAVWERAETYDAQLGSPLGWLVRIARNRAIDRVRAKGVRARTAAADLDGRSVLEARADAADADPEHAASGRELRREVLEALGTLPPEQRRLIECAYYLGYTQSELAELFQIPLGTVKTRVRTGMLALRDALRHLL
jgi:RNA polymerase sigma-70 factor (ECF subfamily)